MNTTAHLKNPAGASLLVSAAAIVGCGSQPPLATVSGSVRHGDEPLEGLLVTFLPDPEHGTAGPHTSAVTDDSGRFELASRSEEGSAGTTVGWHKVVIEDFAAENSRAAPTAYRRRVPTEYRLAATTPLDVHVQPGKQTFQFQIENVTGTDTE